MATLVVEDGSVVEGANTYIDLGDFKSWLDDRNYDYSAIDDADLDAALLRAAAYLDDLNWKGVKTGRDNPMAWPRYGQEEGGNLWNRLEWPSTSWVGVLDRDGFYVAIDEVPAEVVKAQCELAWTIASGTDPEPNLERGGEIKRERVDVIETEYFPGATPDTRFTAVVHRLRGLIKDTGSLSIVRS